MTKGKRRKADRDFLRRGWGLHSVNVSVKERKTAASYITLSARRLAHHLNLHCGVIQVSVRNHDR